MATIDSTHHFPLTSGLPKRVRTIKGFSKAIYTVFAVPEHDASLSIETAMTQKERPLQPELKHELKRVHLLLEKYRDNTRSGQSVYAIDPVKLLGTTGILMQFTSYIPELRPYAITPFAHIDNLYKAIVEEGKVAPVVFSRQLEIALIQTNGNILEALWRLFITARLHARWYDTSVILDMPSMSREKVLERMKAFSNALAACKKNTDHTQDVSGDAYYCWTHALSSVIYNSPPHQKYPMLRRLFTYILRKGTWLNHTLAHKFKPQALPSDHTIASHYGNEIGALCLNKLAEVPASQSSKTIA